MVHVFFLYFSSNLKFAVKADFKNLANKAIRFFANSVKYFWNKSSEKKKKVWIRWFQK